jgi:hypothetical protein
MVTRRVRGWAAKLARWLFDPLRIQAWAALLVAAATILLVAVTWQYVRLTHRLLQAQTEPQVVFEFDLGRREMVLANQGIDRIGGVAVKVDSAAIAGPPENALLLAVQMSPEIPDRKAPPWWDLGTLEPGASVRKGIAGVGDDALQLLTMAEKTHSAEQQRTGFPASKRGQILCVLAFRLTYRREVDRRSYRETRMVWVFHDSMVWVFHDSKDAKRPAFWNPDLGRTSFDKLLELVPSSRR